MLRQKITEKSTSKDMPAHQKSSRGRLPKRDLLLYGKKIVRYTFIFHRSLPFLNPD